MNSTVIQRAFLPMFGMLLAIDFLAQLATSAGAVELQPLLSLWTGPLDDIFYGLAGVQALYYLVDPTGETRDAPVMSWTATVKKIAGLASSECHRRAFLPKLFLTGGLRSAAVLGDGVIMAMIAHKLSATVAFAALLQVLQRHLSFVLPIACFGAVVLFATLQARPQRLWFLAMSVSFSALLLSMAYDGRWAHHVHHLLASLSHPQAWGAALCWIAAAASLPLSTFAVEPFEAKETVVAV